MKKKDKNFRPPDPKKERILESIAEQIARYKKQPEDPRSEEEIADTWLQYLLLKMDHFC